jgi:hypothetical protein
MLADCSVDQLPAILRVLMVQHLIDYGDARLLT